MNTLRGIKVFSVLVMVVLVLLAVTQSVTPTVEATGPLNYGYCTRVVNRQEANCISGVRNTQSVPINMSAHFEQFQFNYLTVVGIEVGLESDAVVYCTADCTLLVNPGDAIEITVRYKPAVPKKWYLQRKNGVYRFPLNGGYTRAYDGDGVMFIYTESVFLMELTSASGYSRSWRHLVIYEN